MDRQIQYDRFLTYDDIDQPPLIDITNLSIAAGLEGVEHASDFPLLLRADT